MIKFVHEITNDSKKSSDLTLKPCSNKDSVKLVSSSRTSLSKKGTFPHPVFTL